MKKILIIKKKEKKLWIKEQKLKGNQFLKKKKLIMKKVKKLIRINCLKLMIFYRDLNRENKANWIKIKMVK